MQKATHPPIVVPDSDHEGITSVPVVKAVGGHAGHAAVTMTVADMDEVGSLNFIVNAIKKYHVKMIGRSKKHAY